MMKQISQQDINKLFSRIDDLECKLARYGHKESKNANNINNKLNQVIGLVGAFTVMTVILCAYIMTYVLPIK